jgi:hypothetical protein
MGRIISCASLLLFGFAACSDGSGDGGSPGVAGRSSGGSGTAGGPGAAGAGTGQGGSEGTSGPGAGGGTSVGLPCDVDQVLVSKCQGCHAATPIFGAPMPLVTYADTQGPAHSNPSVPVWQMMHTRVHSTSSPMPPNGQTALSGGELASLDAWFSAGAPSDHAACRGSGTGSDGGGSLTDNIGPQYLPCTPSHVMTAHANGSSAAKFPVPNPTSDSYVCFNFKSPFAAGEQATAFAPILDDTRVIHHWILYGTNSQLTDGSITTNCQSATLTDTMVTGWAPGGQNMVMDPDVGLVLDYQYFQLQVHYNNALYADGADASGVAFCTTNTPRENAAGIVTLGSMLFSIPANANDFAVNSSCSNLAGDGKTPMTVIGTSPHMHLLGTGFRTQHMRGSTDMGDLSNVPLGTWSFDAQKHYTISPRRQVMPGDVLKTTCYYDNPTSSAVNFGTRTKDEMCFDFITVYPYAAATRKCPGLFGL